MSATAIGDDQRIIDLDSNYVLAEDPDALFAGGADWDKLGHITTWSDFSRALLPDWIASAGIACPRILAIGCGPGVFCRGLMDAGVRMEYHGCDVDPLAIEAARQLCDGQAQFHLCSGDDLAFDDGSFDIVMFESSLAYIQYYGSAISEACRVSRKKVISFHIPVFLREKTAVFRRTVLNTRIIPEICINEEEMLKIFWSRGYSLAAVSTSTVRYVPLKTPAFGIACFRSHLFTS